MRRLATWLVTAGLVVGAASVAVAQGPPPGPPPMHGGPMMHDRLVAALGLTDEQQAAWDSARRSMESQMGPVREQSHALRREIGALLEQPGADPTVIGQKVIALHELEKQLGAARRELDSTLESLLTPEQKAKLQSLRASMPPMPPPGPRGGPRGPAGR